MLPIPDLDAVDVSFGNIKHMPRQADIPEQFKRNSGTPFNDAVSKWFFNGAQSFGSDGLQIGNDTFTPKEGVDGKKALRAIKAVLGSFEPKHEHKESACAFMLSEWFDRKPAQP
jgi:hypothetical protein